MLTRSAAIAAVVGLAAIATAQTRLEYQVSLAGQENWFSSIDVTPGTSVDIRARVSYVGAQTALGLGSVIFQPTISNWGVADTYYAVPSVGMSVDGPGIYGRIAPYPRSNGNTSQSYVGHVNNVSGTNYLRIALPPITSWFGGTGNTAAGSGVLIGQINRDVVNRPVNHPPFSGLLSDVVVFKFKVTIGASSPLRTLTVNTPTIGFGNYESSTGLRNGNWFANYTEPVGSIEAAAFATQAFIHIVPSTGTCTLLIAGALAARRRRK
jgi:hypothetical protein